MLPYLSIRKSPLPSPSIWTRVSPRLLSSSTSSISRLSSSSRSICSMIWLLKSSYSLTILGRIYWPCFGDWPNLSDPLGDLLSIPKALALAYSSDVVYMACRANIGPGTDFLLSGVTVVSLECSTFDPRVPRLTPFASYWVFYFWTSEPRRPTLF